MFWIAAAWNYFFGWAGFDFLVGLACIAVAVFETWVINSVPVIVAKLIPDLRKWAIAGAVVAFTCMGCIAYGHRNGIDFTRAQWNAALANETANGNKAHDDAVRTVGPVSADRGVFSNDRRNRDARPSASKRSSALRWMAGHHVFSK